MNRFLKKQLLFRVNLGCGQSPTKGWRNFDNSPSLRLSCIPLLSKVLLAIGFLDKAQYEFIAFSRRNKIEFADVIKGIPIADGSVEVLYCSHLIERFDCYDVDLFMKEAQRVLCVGGILRLAIPDLKKQAMDYIKSNDANQFMKALMVTGSKPRSMAQKFKILTLGTRQLLWRYDEDSLRQILQAYNFNNVFLLQVGETTISRPEPLDLSERSEESIYIEATKL